MTKKFDPIPEIEEKKSSASDAEGNKVRSIYEQFAQFDEKAEEDGVWTDSIGEGMEIKIRSYSSRAVTDVQQRMMMAFADKQDKDGEFPPETANEMSSRVVAQGMIADWRGPAFVDPDGNEIKHSPEAAYHFAKMSKHFRIAIFAFSMNNENYKAKIEDDAAKNS